MRMSWFPPHFWQIFSRDLEFWIDNFSFQHLKNVPLSSGLHGFWWETCYHFVWPLKEMFHFPLAAFKIFFSFDFSFQFDYSVPWYRFLWVYLFWCLLSPLNLLVYGILPNLGNCQPSFLEYFFSSTISLLTWDSKDMTGFVCLFFAIVPPTPKAPFIFFFSLCSID